jgi:hypothetical protein
MGPLSVLHVHPIFGVSKFDRYDLRAWKLFGGFLVCDHESSIRSHRLLPVTFFFDLSRRPVLRLKERSFKAGGRKFESCRSLYRLSSKLNSGAVAETVAGARHCSARTLVAGPYNSRRSSSYARTSPLLCLRSYAGSMLR